MNVNNRSIEELIKIADSSWRDLIEGPITLINERSKRFEARVIKKQVLDILSAALDDEECALVVNFFQEYLFFGNADQCRMAYELFLQSLYSDNVNQQRIANAMSDFYLMDGNNPSVHKMIQQVGKESWLCPEDVAEKLQLKSAYVVR
jgi:hypothetical protein